MLRVDRTLLILSLKEHSNADEDYSSVAINPSYWRSAPLTPFQNAKSVLRKAF